MCLAFCSVLQETEKIKHGPCLPRASILILGHELSSGCVINLCILTLNSAVFKTGVNKYVINEPSGKKGRVGQIHKHAHRSAQHSINNIVRLTSSQEIERSYV